MGFFFTQKKLEEKISTTLYDLTHLEINTIIKEDMCASKAPASARLLLHLIATKYDEKLINLGKKYMKYIGEEDESPEHLFRGEKEYEGSAICSFTELSERAKAASIKLTKGKDKVIGYFTEDQVNADIKMLQRIETISDDIRRILTMDGVDPSKGTNIKDTSKDPNSKKEPLKEEIYDFDKKDTANKFRALTTREADKYELNLDLRQLLLIKKANDIGTEKIVLQTIIGIDGDVTTRISQSFADQPVTFINDLHHEAVGISVRFWENLVKVVVKLGKSIIDNLTK